MSTTPRPARIPRGAAAALAVTAAMIAVAGTAGAAQAAPGQQVDPFAPDFGPNVADRLARHSARRGAGDARRRSPPPGRRRDVDRAAQRALPARRLRHRRPIRCSSRSATTPRSPASAPRPTTSTSTARSRSTTAASPTAARRNCLALVNFWRTISNLSLQVNGAGQDGCRASGELLGGVAGRLDAPPRRVGRQPLAHGLLHRRPAVRERRLHRRLAPAVRDQRLAAAVADPQQRGRPAGRTRVWNQVFSGVEGAPDDAAFPNPPYTTIDETPVSREKPYLFVDDRRALQRARARGADRTPAASRGPTARRAGRSIPITDFFIAKPGDSVKDDQQRARARPAPDPHAGRVRHRPARSRSSAPTRSCSAWATRRSPPSAARCRSKVEGCRRASSSPASRSTPAPAQSPVLLQVGKPGNGQARRSTRRTRSRSRDVYFRVGGPHIGKADTALEVNADHVLIDHTWVWRADHGVEGFTERRERRHRPLEHEHRHAPASS